MNPETIVTSGLRRKIIQALPILALLIALGCSSNRDKTLGSQIKAPDFTGATGWINTDKPISMDDLKGQVVVIDFWTYCCINCMHVFPDLKYLEEKYKDQPVVIIGVHSGKFDEEKDAANIKAAVQRHHITHPVAVDNDYKIWNAFGVNAWPTLVVIDPRGNIVGQVGGEGHRNDLDAVISKLLEEGKQDGTLAKPIHFLAKKEQFDSGTLEFPGKILADGKGQRLFISDSSHNRVLITTLDGKITQTLGSGTPGLTDGTFAKASFHFPQGLALSPDGNTLYIADTENHAIRKADLANQTITTLAGSGEQAHTFHPDGPAKTTDLSSPWDLTLLGDRLYIANAGTHQIWLLDLKSQQISLFAGEGIEGATENTALEADFAQPSGLATDGQHLYVATSEASCIQDINLQNNQVKILAGSGDLFGFGKTDGVGSAARFQHPLGVTISPDGKTLYVADTFNNLIRTIDIPTATVKTLAGTGNSDPGTPNHLGYFEPAGLSLLGDQLYIADTNHHRIIRLPIGHPEQSVVLDIRM